MALDYLSYIKLLSSRVENFPELGLYPRVITHRNKMLLYKHMKIVVKYSVRRAIALEWFKYTPFYGRMWFKIGKPIFFYHGFIRKHRAFHRLKKRNITHLLKKLTKNKIPVTSYQAEDVNQYNEQLINDYLEQNLDVPQTDENYFDAYKFVYVEALENLVWCDTLYEGLIEDEGAFAGFDVDTVCYFGECSEYNTFTYGKSKTRSI